MDFVHGMRETVFLGWLFECTFLVVKISRLIPGAEDASRPLPDISHRNPRRCRRKQPDSPSPTGVI
jgi:hypothetical protein